MPYSPRSRAKIIELFFRKDQSYALFVRAWKKRHGKHSNFPTQKTVCSIVQQFRQGRLTPSPRPFFALTEQKIQEVRAVMQGQPTLSLRRIAQQVQLSLSSVWKVARKHLGLKAYKITKNFALKEPDRARRTDFCHWALEKIDQDPSFLDQLWFSDEAHFHLNGYVNSQNCRIWGEENPHVSVQVGLHSRKVTVWAAMSRKAIIGPFFFREGETVTGDRYREMIDNFFIPELYCLGETEDSVLFQQDGATAHTADETMDLLGDYFGNRLISYRANVPWPPRSPDLTPLDFFLWGYLKSRVYADNPRTLEDLKDAIRLEMQSIKAEMLQNVSRSFEGRLEKCIDLNGAQLK